jgi:hypothetical protein
MLRRKFMQLVLVASSSGALAVLGTTARASGGAIRNDNGASVGHSESNENHSGGARDGHSESNENHSGGDSIGHSETNESHNGGASRNHAGGSIYCATDANGQQNCRTETSDGLSTVNDSDLDDVLQSFN